jgi:hypothetical protein
MRTDTFFAVWNSNQIYVVPDKRAKASADPGPITTYIRFYAELGPQRAHQLASVVLDSGVRRDDECDQIGFPAYGSDAVRPPSTGIAWPLT